MGETEREEEEKLINQIRGYKKSFRESLREELVKEREQRHGSGEVFFKGFWVTKDKIADIQRRLQKRGLMIFLEIHILVLFIILLEIVLWIGFKKFLLP
jgi:hypothetical protein